MRLAVVGASGRMGRAVVRLAHAEGISIVCAVGTTDVGRDVGELAGVGPLGACVVDGLGALEHARADVVIDFSAPGATLALAPDRRGRGGPRSSRAPPGWTTRRARRCEAPQAGCRCSGSRT